MGALMSGLQHSVTAVGGSAACGRCLENSQRLRSLETLTALHALTHIWPSILRIALVPKHTRPKQRAYAWATAVIREMSIASAVAELQHGDMYGHVLLSQG